MFRVHIHNQDYSNISLINKNTNEIITYIGFCRDLFHNDEVELNEDGSMKILFRNLPQFLVGELELYSSYILKSNTSTPLYLFRPLNKSYPKFYVHSNCKRNYSTNIWISINNISWNPNNVYPSAKTLDVFGSVNDINSIETALAYHYQLYDPSSHLKYTPQVKYGYDIARTKHTEEIYSIDPKGCRDIDDAFSVKAGEDSFELWIHIADVYGEIMSWYDESSHIVSDIRQYETIYFKNRNIPMLPNLWSSNLCSLLENTEKKMLTLHIKVSHDLKIESKFYPSYGKITKNCEYNDSLSNKLCNRYGQMVEIIYKHFMNIYGVNVPVLESKINNTHDFIEAMMIIYNTYFANVITKNWSYKILRSQKPPKQNYDSAHMDKSLTKFLNLLASNRAEYIVTNENLEHNSLGISGYTHVTSPIRRYIDLINQMLYHCSDNMINHGVAMGIISDVNQYQKKLKKMYREINKIYMLERVYYKPNYSSEFYIYDTNINKNKMSVFFPKEKLSFKTYIIPESVKHLYNIKMINNHICITNIQDTEEKKLEMFKLLPVVLNGHVDLHNIDNSLLFQYPSHL
jgi:exoribonuclease R